MNTLVLEASDARDIVWEEHEDWERVAHSKRITDHRRWTVGYEAVFQHIPTGKHYMFRWCQGATEQQETRPYEIGGKVEVFEVIEVEVLTKQWVPA